MISISSKTRQLIRTFTRLRNLKTPRLMILHTRRLGSEAASAVCSAWLDGVVFQGTPVTEDVTNRHDDGGEATDGASADATYRLLARARAGEREALETLFARHIPTLRRWASGRLPRWARDIADTQDLVQETVLKAFQRVEAFEPRGDGALQAYLRQAVMNRIRNEFRSKGRRPAFGELEDEAPGDRTSPLEAAIRQEQLDRYDAALSRLSEQERDLIVARVEVGLTYEEMAQALGKPSWNAARMATARALLRLAEELKHS